jgi:hypothetical protein
MTAPYNTILAGACFVIYVTWNQPKIDSISETLWESSIL